MRFRGKALVRSALVVVALVCATLEAARQLPGCATGGRHPPAAALESGLGPEARERARAVTSDVDPARLFDYHVHVAGLGTGESGCYVNAKLRSIWHPWRRTQFRVYTRAAGVDDFARADEQLVELVRAIPAHGRYGLLAMDELHGADGRVDRERTELHVPNEYVWRLSTEHPDLFVPIVSVHPYRADAIAELDRYAARGVRIVKWLPNAMGIDPADPRCDAFYDRLAHWSRALLSHAGDEQAVDSAGAQRLGNPLRLRRALDRGVKVIVAHCASTGTGEDLDREHPGKVDNFDLFLRLMDDPRYEKLVYGEISAVCQINRSPRVLRTLLERSDLHARLVNGSDYPLPAIDLLFSTRLLAMRGFLTSEDRAALNEIYRYDPLFFDYAMKRRVRHPETGATFPPHVFMIRPELGP